MMAAGVAPGEKDVILQWNDVVTEAIRADKTQPGPGFSSRNFAIVHAAIYDAVNAVERAYEPYLVNRVAEPATSKVAAAGSAAYHALLGLYPQQAALFDAALATTLAEVKDGPSETRGFDLGKEVALEILETRSDDGAFDPYEYEPGSEPGDWRPAPPLESVSALGPGWGNVVPFALESSSQFRAPPPPKLDSPEYAQSFNELKSLGAVDSATRTADQTEIGVFWGYDRGGLGPPPIFYNQIAQTIALREENSLIENARLFALLNIAQADAGIASWETKYAYDLWRPITAIREGDADGNPETVGDPFWTPLGAPGGGVVPNFTPPFPAYVSGHATFGAAVFRSLANFYGTDDYQFTAQSDELPGVTRSYARFSEAAAENARSRIYLGIHWNFDDQYGQQMGNQIADFVFSTRLRPSPHGRSIYAVGAGPGGGPHVKAVDAETGEAVQSFYAYDQGFQGGVRVAVADVNGDGELDIVTAAGPGGGPHVRVFDGVTGEQLPGPIGSFYAYSPAFHGGVFVAAADFDGDGLADIVTGADAGGGPHVKVFSGFDGALLHSFFAFDMGFQGGVRVAAGDVDGDGLPDIIAGAGAGGGPHVRVFSGANEAQLPGAIGSFFAYASGFGGGVFVAAGDLDGDGLKDVITGAGAGGGPHVRALSGADCSELANFMVFDAAFDGGVTVGCLDLLGEGWMDIVVGPGAGSKSVVRGIRSQDGGETLDANAFAATFGGGAFVAGAAGPRWDLLQRSRLRKSTDEFFAATGAAHADPPVLATRKKNKGANAGKTKS